MKRINDNYSYDSYCKRVLSQKWLIANILKKHVKEYKNCSLEEIVRCIEKPIIDAEDDGKYLTTENVEDVTFPFGKIYYDVVVFARLPHSKDVVGMVINLEAQASTPRYPLLKRAIYYLARLLSRQKGAEHGFQKSDYGNLKKVVGIWIYNQGVKAQGMINTYSFEEKVLGTEIHMKKEDYDLMELIIISPRSEVTGEDDVMDILSLLFGNNKIPSKDTLCILEEKYGIVLTEKDRKEIEEMCNWSQVKYEYGYEDGCRDTEIRMEKESSRKIAMNLLKESLPLQLIVKTTGVSLEDLLELRKQLELIPA